jgi:hypothetical protein
MAAAVGVARVIVGGARGVVGMARVIVPGMAVVTVVVHASRT